ncbi:hypothetical protein PHLCEN_2v12064 [Hermanssonia centrifuga]|uniref:Uncharacterized protein n=1 Tax=Hermanssonia centrifuga TaxID=98765 RepID=A0A2R6NID1_9APHY|nr:hypothetical protein PHLCEN_2v12064 [Hermanssonia centrifuga]
MDELENILALMREFPHICSYPKSLVLWCCTDTLAVLKLHTLRTIISHLTELDEVKFVGTHLRVSKEQSPLARTAFDQLQKPHLRIPRLKILCMHGDLPMTRHSWDAIMAIFDEVEETSLVGAGIRSYGASDPHTGAL